MKAIDWTKPVEIDISNGTTDCRVWAKAEVVRVLSGGRAILLYENSDGDERVFVSTNDTSWVRNIPVNPLIESLEEIAAINDLEDVLSAPKIVAIRMRIASLIQLIKECGYGNENL